jgi:integrase
LTFWPVRTKWATCSLTACRGCCIRRRNAYGRTVADKTPPSGLPVQHRRSARDQEWMTTRSHQNDYVFSSPKTKSCLRETKRGFRVTCKLAGIEGLIWKDLRATFGTRLTEAGCDAFTIAQLLGHSGVRVTMRCVRAVEDTKRVEAIKLSARKNVQVLASWQKQPPVPAAVSH